MPDQTAEESVTGHEYADRTVYTGSRQALVGAGLAAYGPFPGDVTHDTTIRDQDPSGRRRRVNERLAQLSQELADVSETTRLFTDRAAQWVDLAFMAFVHTFMAEGVHAMQRERAALADADFQRMLEDLLSLRTR